MKKIPSLATLTLASILSVVPAQADNTRVIKIDPNQDGKIDYVITERLLHNDQNRLKKKIELFDKNVDGKTDIKVTTSYVYKGKTANIFSKKKVWDSNMDGKPDYSIFKIYKYNSKCELHSLRTWKKRFDEKGRILQTLQYELKGLEKIPKWEHDRFYTTMKKKTYQYNAQGKVCEEVYEEDKYGSAHVGCLFSGNFGGNADGNIDTRIVKIFDDNGKIISYGKETDHDSNGIMDSTHIKTYFYDTKGRENYEIEEKRYSCENFPTLKFKSWEYNDKGRLSRYTVRTDDDKDGKPDRLISGINYHYDKTLNAVFAVPDPGYIKPIVETPFFESNEDLIRHAFQRMNRICGFWNLK